ncbi:MAG TPA: Crp/Fnr family transcriptional regulator [Bacteroidales bacterium]|nr:Crp/Fnr family transcriptional regulator [Bacteroidales bacterium]
MDRYLTRTDCIECSFRSGCFIQRTKNAEKFYKSVKSQIHYKKGETIVKEGVQVNSILYLMDGLVKLYIESPEKNIIIRLINSDDFIGLTSLFADDTYYFSASALKETRVCSIDCKDIKELITQCCEFSRELSNWYCKNYNIMLTKCLNLGLRQLNGKLANTLLYLNRQEFKNTDIFSFISRKDLAELSGMSMESVVRILSEFDEENIIELKGRKIEIKDLERLKIINQKG